MEVLIWFRCTFWRWRGRMESRPDVKSTVQLWPTGG